MKWTRDGWLRLYGGGNLAKEYVEESRLPECRLPQIPDFDDFDSGVLGSQYYAPRIMPCRFADVKARPGYVRIRGQESRTSLNKVSILARKLTSVYATITTKMEFQPEIHQSDEYCKYGEFTGTFVGLTCADRVKHRHYADFDFFSATLPPHHS